MKLSFGRQRFRSLTTREEKGGEHREQFSLKNSGGIRVSFVFTSHGFFPRGDNCMAQSQSILAASDALGPGDHITNARWPDFLLKDEERTFILEKGPGSSEDQGAVNEFCGQFYAAFGTHVDPTAMTRFLEKAAKVRRRRSRNGGNGRAKEEQTALVRPAMQRTPYCARA